MLPELTDEERKHYLVGTFNYNPDRFCPVNCEYLSITEAAQNKRINKPDHICLKYLIRVKHGAFHPNIMKCDQCIHRE